MEKGKGSSLVYLLLIVLSLVAFGFSIAAERRRSIISIHVIFLNASFNLEYAERLLIPVKLFGWSLHARGYTFGPKEGSTGTLHTDEVSNATYCVYSSDVATGYGVGAFLFLLSSESLLMGVTKCMCFGRALVPGSNRAWTIIYFVSSWLSFLVAEACLIAGARNNAYHTKYRDVIYAHDFSCSTLRKGVFIAGAVFVIATMVLNVYFYMYFIKATTTKLAEKINRASSSVGMTGFA